MFTQAAQAEAAKTGVGVSTEAQQVFDALAKTMPCHWRQQSIIILNEVSVERHSDANIVYLCETEGVHTLQVELRPPYCLSDCSTESSHDLTTLERVRKVVRIMLGTLILCCYVMYLQFDKTFYDVQLTAERRRLGLP